MGKKKKKESIEQSIAAYGSGRRVYYPREDLQNSALWSCVVNLSRLYASMPWHAYKVMPNGDRKKEEGSVLAALLKKPNAYMTSYDFRFVMGFNFDWVYQKTNQVETGFRRTSSGSFKINLFSINIGMTFYL